MIELFKEMFDRMVLEKNADRIEHYYHKDFLLYSNNTTMNYQEFLASHREYYAKDIQYTIRYDDETWVVQGNKLAARIFISVTESFEAPKELEIILIVQYQQGQIYRIWELTYPDWSQLATFRETEA